MRILLIISTVFLFSCGKNASVQKIKPVDADTLIAIPDLIEEHDSEEGNNSNTLVNEDSSSESESEMSEAVDDSSEEASSVADSNDQSSSSDEEQSNTTNSNQENTNASNESNSEDVDDESICSIDEENELDLIAGEYSSGCVVVKKGQSTITNLTITDDSDYNLTYKMFKGNNCKSPQAKIEYVYEISVDGCIDDESENLKVDFKAKSIDLTPQSQSYSKSLNKLEECNIDNWEKGEEYDLTGQNCPFLLSKDPFHDAFKDVDEFVYGTFLPSENTIALGDWTTNSGDTEEERITKVKETVDYVLLRE